MYRLIILGVFFCLPAFAQTGPGGVGATANNVVWFSADSGVYVDAGVTLATDNDAVQEWHYRSGNGYIAMETTAADQPTYRTSIVNGFPVLRFDGSNSRILATGVASSNQASLWVVGQYFSLPSSNPGLIHAAPAGSAFSTSASSKTLGMWVASSNNRVWVRGVQSDNTIRSISQAITLSTNTFYSILNEYDGSNIQQYVDNTASGNISYDGTLASWSDFGMGRQANESWNGDISEVIVYNFAVNSAQRIIVDNYLAAKYNLSLTSNDIYDMDDAANGDYDYEVAGIGRVDASNIHNDARGSSIVRISKSSFGGLGNDEFLIWGHDNGPLTSGGFTDVPSGVVTRLGRIWRVTEANASGSSVNVGRTFIDFDLSGLNPPAAADLRLLIDTNGDGDFSDATAFTVSTSLGGDVFRFNIAGGQLRDTRTFTIATASTILPIELLSFDVNLNGNQVDITWATASETNNDFFTIQRSTDGQEFMDVLRVDGAGDSEITLNYHTVDINPLPGRSFYRLKQTDFDGTFSYSNIESVFRPASGLLTIFPNPTSEEVHIKTDAEAAGSALLTLYDDLGKKIMETVINFNQGVHVQCLKLPDLANGIYLMQTRGGLSSSIPLIIER